MAAHRYWRVKGLDSRGSTGLDITEFHLLAAGVRVDASATLTSNYAPASGSLANLKDDNTSTGATWPAAQVSTLVLSWDFGGGGDQDVNDVRIGAADLIGKWIKGFRLEYSDNATTWTVHTWNTNPLLGILGLSPAWPGARTKTISRPRLFNWRDRLFAGGGSVSADGSTYESRAVVLVERVLGYSPHSSGVRQLEFTYTPVTTPAIFGVVIGSDPASNPVGYNGLNNGWGIVPNNGFKAYNSAQTAFTSGWTTGQVVGVVVNFTAGSISVYADGVLKGGGPMFTGITPSAALYPAAYLQPNSQSSVTLKTSGFAFPIAGATAWDDQSLIAQIEFGDNPILVFGESAPASSGYAPLSTYGSLFHSDMQTALLRKTMFSRVTSVDNGRISGTVKEDGSPDIPVRRHVILLREPDLLPVRDTWSNPVTGAYSFDYVDETYKYLVFALDYEHDFRAVIADNLTPDLIP